MYQKKLFEDHTPDDLFYLLTDYNATHGWELFVEDIFKTSKFSWGKRKVTYLSETDGTRIRIRCSNDAILNEDLFLLESLLSVFRFTWFLGKNS
ncbi:MAG: hypothetical protein ACTSYA_02890 [Candidatus Kariarchaeaceae archaeon]